MRKTAIALMLVFTGAFLLWQFREETFPWVRSMVGGTPQKAPQNTESAAKARVHKRPIEEIWASGDVLSTLAVAIDKDPAWLRRLLEQEGVDPNVKMAYQGGKRWAHPLEKAARDGSQETFDILLAAGADPNGRSTGGFTALHAAARRGSLGVIKGLLAAGADPNLLSDAGGAPIEFAARWGHREELEALIAGGADLRLALHSAATGGHVEIIQLLFDLGADPKGLNLDGHTTLVGAVNDEHLQATELLLAAGARPGPKSLRKAARGGHLKTLRAYAEAGVRFDTPPAAWDALYTASHEGQVDAVRLLLELGASPHGGKNIKTPIDAAIEQGHDEVVAVLRAAGTEPSTPVEE